MTFYRRPVIFVIQSPVIAASPDQNPIGQQALVQIAYPRRAEKKIVRLSVPHLHSNRFQFSFQPDAFFSHQPDGFLPIFLLPQRGDPCLRRQHADPPALSGSLHTRQKLPVPADAVSETDPRHGVHFRK